MDNSTIATAKAAIAALDFSEEISRIAEKEDLIARGEGAISDAEERCQAIARELAEWRGQDGRQVADALLDDPAGGVTLAARAGKGFNELEEEREALRAAIVELRRRDTDLRGEIETIKRLGRDKLIRAVAPIVEALLAEQREHAARLVDGFAAVQALCCSVHGFGQAERMMADAVAGMVGNGKLLPHRGSLPIPQPIVDCIELAQSKGPGLGITRIPSANIP